MSSAETFLARSQVYEPVAVLRRGGEILIVARAGMKAMGDRHPAASDPRPFRLERSSSRLLAKAFGLERLLISLSACLAVERVV